MAGLGQGLTRLLTRAASAQAPRVLCRSLHTSYRRHETIPIRLPALSPTMTEGSIVEWHKKEGEEVAVGDVLFDIETDKATMAVEATEDGFLRQIVIGDNTTGIALNTIVALMTEDLEEEPVMPEEAPTVEKKAEAKPVEKAAAPAQTAAPAKPASPSVAATTKPLSPAVRALVDRNGLDASIIPATGPKNYLLKGDVLAFLEGKSPSLAAPTSAASPSKAASKPSASKPDPSTAGSRRKRQRGSMDVPASGMRKTIAARLTESKSTIPHAYSLGEADITELMALRKQLIAETGHKFTLNDVVIKAAAMACRSVPIANAAFVDGNIRHNPTVDVSIAVATPGGLITPIVFNADKHSVGAISTSFGELAGKAREGRLQPHEYQGGTFSISNLGMFGITNFTAIINPPHACNLAVGTTRAMPHPTKGVAQQIRFQLSADERVVSQDDATRWLDVFKSYLENPKVVLTGLAYTALEDY